MQGPRRAALLNAVHLTAGYQSTAGLDDGHVGFLCARKIDLIAVAAHDHRQINGLFCINRPDCHRLWFRATRLVGGVTCIGGLERVAALRQSFSYGQAGLAAVVQRRLAQTAVVGDESHHAGERTGSGDHATPFVR